MPCRDAALATPFQDGMDGDEPILLEDADLTSGAVHLDRTAACRVGHAIEIAVDRDHAVAGDAPLHPQHRLERAGRQSLEAWVLFGEMLGDDTPRGGMDAHIGHRIEPVVELCIEVLEIAELAAEEEVLTHVAERALDLALGLGAIRAARLGQEAVMAREVEQRAIVDDVTSLGVVTDHRRLHAVVEDLLWHATECFEGGDVAAQDCRQILMQHEAAPHHSAVPEHQREQPDDANDAGLVSELGLELREVHLGLLAWRRLEAQLKGRRHDRPDLAQQVGHRRVAATIAQRRELTVQAAPGQLGNRRKPLTQIRLERL